MAWFDGLRWARFPRRLRARKALRVASERRVPSPGKGDYGPVRRPSISASSVGIRITVRRPIFFAATCFSLISSYSFVRPIPVASHASATVQLIRSRKGIPVIAQLQLCLRLHRHTLHWKPYRRANPHKKDATKLRNVLYLMGDNDLDGSRHADPLPKPSTCSGGDQTPSDPVVLRPGEHGSIVGDDHAWLAAPRAGLRSRCRGSPPGPPASHHRRRSGCGIAGRRTGHGRESTEHRRSLEINQERRPRSHGAPPSPSPGRRKAFFAKRPRDAVDAQGSPSCRNTTNSRRYSMFPLVGEIAQLRPSGRHER
jgi:hypothetical protein